MTTVDLLIFQGDSYSAVVTVYNTDGTPADITGYTAQAQIRRGVADSAKVIDCEMTCTVESPLIRLAISHAQTEQLAGDYIWDLQLTVPPAHVVTILSGRVRAKQEVTRIGSGTLALRMAL